MTHAGQKRWADEGLKLAAVATALSVGYLKVSARIAERFDPARRFPNLTREHYRGLCCFPVEFTDKWLPTVVEKGFGAKTLRALAVEAYGSDPKQGYSKNKQRSFAIPETLFARLKEASPIPKVAVFIKVVLEEWLNTATTEQQSRVAASLLTLEEANHQRRRAERNEKIAAKVAARDKREAEKLAQKAEKDAFYEAERVQREAEKAERKAEKQKFDDTERVKREAEKVAARDKMGADKLARKAAREAMTAAAETRRRAKHCDEVAEYAARLGKEVRWPTKEEADEVAVEFSASRGYLIESFLCDKCSQWHVDRAVRTDESDGNESDHAQPRPDYAERRATQIASAL